MNRLLFPVAFSAMFVAGLRDAPIATSVEVLYLDGPQWVVTNIDSSISVGGLVPGDLISDLENAGIIPDVLHEQNFLPPLGSQPQPGAPYGQPLWDNQTWTYSRTFDLPWQIADFSDIALVFDGVKMAANVSLNGVFLGTVSDMFLRYRFPISKLLLPASNTVQLAFYTSNDTANNEGRWTSCSGGWDWAFYSTTSNPSGPNLRSFSKGIWKSVYIVGTPVDFTSIEHVVPLVYYNASYPTALLVDGNNGPWYVDTTVHFSTPAPANGTLTVSGSWPGASSPVIIATALPAGNASVTVTLPAANVNLWWPNGLGKQAMYTVSVSWVASAVGSTPITDSRRVGFRTLYLVTANDADPASLLSSEGSGNFTMRWRVNGANIYSFGGNVIPIDEMEGRYSDLTFQQFAYSAAAAGFNTFRMWGGGVYPPQAFYDACDEVGILMYHDAMYSSDGRIPPANTPLEDAELRYNVRRIAYHPCIAHWDSCNECDPVNVPIYHTFVATVMSQEDPSRPIWPSCPSQGWSTGVHTLTGLPNGNPLIPIGTPKQARRPRDGVLAPPLAPGAPKPDPRPYAGAVKLALPSAASDAGPDAQCTVQVDVDYDHGTVWITTPASDAGDCCAQCTANATSCWCATFWEGTCFWKHYNATPSYNPGVVTVWPPGNGPIPPNPPVWVAVEAHGPYQHGGGFPAVNGNQNDGAFNPNIPINLAPTYTQFGPNAPGTFYSEFGASAWSSFESVAPTLDPPHWGLGGGMPPNPAATCTGGFSGICPGPNPIAQRNYPPHSFILTYFPSPGLAPSLNETGTIPFQRQLYLAVLAQALEMKADIGTRRTNAHTGTVYWQANEIWPTGGWGSLEYGSVGHTAGQVVGGRWKILHHWVASILYRDVFFTCGADGRCLVRNDNAAAGVTGSAVARLLHIKNSSSHADPPVTVSVNPVSLGVGFGAVQTFCLGGGNTSAGCETISSVLQRFGCAVTGDDCILLLEVDATDGSVAAVSWELLAVPGALAPNLPPAIVSATVSSTPNADNSVNVTLTSTSGSTALFVTLTTLAQGRFSENAVIIPGGAVSPTAGAWGGGSSVTLRFIGFPTAPDGTSGVVDIDSLMTSLRVEHLAQYV